MGLDLHKDKKEESTEETNPVPAEPVPAEPVPAEPVPEVEVTPPSEVEEKEKVDTAATSKKYDGGAIPRKNRK